MPASMGAASRPARRALCLCGPRPGRAPLVDAALPRGRKGPRGGAPLMSPDRSVGPAGPVTRAAATLCNHLNRKTDHISQHQPGGRCRRASSLLDSRLQAQKRVPIDHPAVTERCHSLSRPFLVLMASGRTSRRTPSSRQPLISSEQQSA